jgi:hypothetical protein
MSFPVFSHPVPNPSLVLDCLASPEFSEYFYSGGPFIKNEFGGLSPSGTGCGFHTRFETGGVIGFFGRSTWATAGGATTARLDTSIAFSVSSIERLPGYRP